MIFLLLPKINAFNKKIILTQKNNFQMKKLLTKLFSYLPIINQRYVMKLSQLKTGNKKAGITSRPQHHNHVSTLLLSKTYKPDFRASELRQLLIGLKKN